MLGFQILPDDQTRPDATVVPPKVDSLLAAEQWGSFSEILVDMYRRKNIRDFLGSEEKFKAVDWLVDAAPFLARFRKDHSKSVRKVQKRKGSKKQKLNPAMPSKIRMIRRN